MSTSVVFGLKKLEYAPVESDGSMPADEAFEELCRTFRDSFEIVDADPDVQNEYSDQDFEPIFSSMEAGDSTGKFSAFEFDNATLQKLDPSGTVVDETFEFGRNMGFETALRLITDSGHIISYARVKLFAKKNIRLVKKSIALVDCQFTPLSPARISLESDD